MSTEDIVIIVNRNTEDTKIDAPAEDRVITVNKPTEEVDMTMHTSAEDEASVNGKVIEEITSDTPVEEETDTVNEAAEEIKPTMPLVSVVIAVTDIDILVKHIGSITAQDYANIEIILVNNDKSGDFEAKLRLLIKKCSRKFSVKTIQFERTHGYAFEPVSVNELYLAGAEQATGNYLLFKEENISYNSTYISKAVQKLQNEQADFAFTDLVITWKDGVSYRYIHEIDVGENIFSAYIKNAGKLFGLSNSETKLISRELWQKVKGDFASHYENEENHAALYAGELILADLLWSNTVKAVYVPEIFAIVNWSEVDTKISIYGDERKSGRIVSEINEALGFTSDICVKKNVSMVDYKEYVAEFLSRVIWRTDWVNRAIRPECEAIFGLSVLEYSIVNAFAGRIFTVDLSEYKTQLDNLSTETDMKIKIFISMHKPSFVPENNKYLFPIQNGSIYAEERFPDTLHDDEGENISIKKEMYNELSAQYWAWKNCKDADYYGFWHYRRFFSFNENEHPHEGGYITHDVLNHETMEKSFIDEKHIEDICKDYDFVLPRPWICYEDGKQMTVYEHWCRHFNKSDIDVAVKVIIKNFPEYYDAVMDVLQSESLPVCNMFIMKKELFNEYSNFLFTVLGEVERNINQKLYNPEEHRTIGHLGERLLAVFAKYVELTKPDIDICYLERTLYEDTRPVAKIVHPGKDKCVSIMLACNDIYMPYTDVLLQSICENTSDDHFYDIVILHRDITEYNQEIAKNIFAKKSNISLRFADVTRNFEKYSNVHVDRHLTLETYYRFLALDVFEGYDRVLYIDCDTVVNTDLAELFFTDMDNEYIAAVRDYDMIAQCVYSKEWYTEHVLKYINIDDFFNYFQAGVILFNIKALKKEFTTEKLFNVALSRNWHFHDQDVLNCLFNGNIKYLEDRWNVFSLLGENENYGRRALLTKYLAAEFAFSYKRSRKNPAIIHYAGIPKVWNDTSVDLGYFFWHYARKSPFYEKLLTDLMVGEKKTDRILFATNPEENKGAKLFTIKTLKDVWSSNYAVIDFIFLSNHDIIQTDTLTVSASLLQNDKGEKQLDVKQFSWEKNMPVIADNILFAINQENDIEVFVRPVEMYTGFSFAVRSIESRSMQKPNIEVNVNNYDWIDQAVEIPDDARKGW